MSSIGSPIDTSLLQTAQAQQSATKMRDREKAASESGRRRKDLVDLQVAGVEDAQALRKLPHNDSEEADAERDARDEPHAQDQPQDGLDDDEQRPHIDVKG